MSTDDPLHLIELYLDDELEPAQEAELIQWLSANQENRRIFIRETHLHHSLRVACLTRQVLAHLETGVPETITAARRRKPLASPRESLKLWPAVLALSRRAWFQAACAGTLLILGTIALWSYGKMPEAVLRAIGPGVELVRDGVPAAVRSETGLRNRDEIIIGPRSSALLTYGKEGTEIEFEPGAAAMITRTNRTRWIHVRQGTVYATVASQKRGKSLVFMSPQGHATVVGTELKFMVDNDKTTVEVYSGKVQFASLRGANRVELASGHYASVDAAGITEALQIPAPDGRILWECWTSIAGDQVSDLTNNPAFPDHPTDQRYLTSFEQPQNWGDRFGSRIRGFVCPAVTGEYSFWIAADDAGELWLSQSEFPELAERVCFTKTFTAPDEWEKAPEQHSRSFRLVGGRKYYIEARMKEGGGVDCLGVAWDGPGLQRSVIRGKYLMSPAATKVVTER